MSDEVKLLPCEETPELKSCPFCASDDVEVQSDMDEWEISQVRCRKCGATAAIGRSSCNITAQKLGNHLNALANTIQSPSDRIDDLQLVADLALCWLGEREPGDSRAVSDEVVAMAAIVCEQDNLEECRSIVRAALHQEGIAP